MGGRGRRFIEASLIETDLRKRLGRGEGSAAGSAEEGRKEPLESYPLPWHPHSHAQVTQ